MRDLLPPGAFVSVNEPATESCEARTYIARVVGYDMGHTKYELGIRFGGWGEWLFADGGVWAAPGWCQEVSEEEATR